MWSARCAKHCQRTLSPLLHNLPSNHPALLWTHGTTSASCVSQKHYSLNFNDHNKSLELKRNPRALHSRSLYVTSCLDAIKGVSNQETFSKSLALPCKSNSSLVPVLSKSNARSLYSQKQEQSQRPFILSPQGIVEASPASVQPYLKLVRLDRPIGTWLLFLPCTFSLSLAAPAGCLPDPYMLTLFGLGSILMRGAGCTINDMWDKDFDAKVARTKDRPLACGDLTYFQALSFLGLQLSGALAILLTFNWYTIALGVSSLGLCITYPLMKRITYWPQAFLGLTFNWGCMMGYSAASGAVSWPVVAPLYAGCFAWTIVYDTIYAHQDKEDDLLVGVKSTALWMGEQTKPWLGGFTAAIVGSLGASGLLAGQTWPYFLGVAAFGAHLARQVYTVDLNNTADCGRKFRSNRNIGLMLWLAIMAGNLLREPEPGPDTEPEREGE